MGDGFQTKFLEPSGFAKLSQDNCRAKEGPGTLWGFKAPLLLPVLFQGLVWKKQSGSYEDAYKNITVGIRS